jgi:formylglycine-generating enzyme required for sulfatase activity
MGRNPSQFSRNTVRPVERVSWYDAIEFCIELTNRTPGLQQVYTMSNIQRSPTALPGTPGQSIFPIVDATVTANWAANGFRLPTEAEWEFAARGGNGTPGNFIYSGSNNPEAVAWYNVTVGREPEGMRATQMVGRLAPNALGIFDMSGNVSEWVWDWFASYTAIISGHSSSDAYNNPRGPLSGTERVRRGGGWSNAAGNVRSVVRMSDTPGTATWVNGFRVARGPSVIW